VHVTLAVISLFTSNCLPSLVTRTYRLQKKVNATLKKNSTLENVAIELQLTRHDAEKRKQMPNAAMPSRR
jgi:hypothetical protein